MKGVDVRWVHNCTKSSVTVEDAKALYEGLAAILVETGHADLRLGDLVGVLLGEDCICFACLSNLVRHFAAEGCELREDLVPNCEENEVAVLSALSECAHALAIDRQRPLVASKVLAQALEVPPEAKA